jgi:hypothetical protein
MVNARDWGGFILYSEQRSALATLSTRVAQKLIANWLPRNRVQGSESRLRGRAHWSTVTYSSSSDEVLELTNLSSKGEGPR